MAINDTVLRINDDGSCEPALLKGYPTVVSPDSSITVTPVENVTTGVIEYQIGTTYVTYTFTETNTNDGDGVIEWTVTGTEQPSGTVVSTQVISIPEETEGVHFSGQPTHNVTTGIITFPTVNDFDESAATPLTLDVSDDECAEYAPSPTDFDTFKVHGCDSGGKGSTTLCEIFANLPVATDFVGG